MLPRVARRLHHGRDLGEPFDFLTWCEYAPADAPGFEELVDGLLYSRYCGIDVHKQTAVACERAANEGDSHVRHDDRCEHVQNGWSELIRMLPEVLVSASCITP